MWGVQTTKQEAQKNLKFVSQTQKTKEKTRAEN